MLPSLNYPDNKPYQNLAPTKTLPSCSLHPVSQPPINHIKPPKPKPLPPSTVHYPTQSPLKTITIYVPELVLLDPNTQLYIDNYGLNHYHSTPITFLYISPPSFFSTNTNQSTNHVKRSPPVSP